MIVCAGGNELIEGALPIGIGLIDSTINLTRLLLFDPPSSILFVGSAGTYGDHEIFQIVESKSASHIEGSFAIQQSYTPLDNLISSASDVSRETIVNSSNYITKDAILAQKFRSMGLGIENMEFFAVMRVAQAFGVSAGGVFVITNRCDETAHEQFIRHHNEAKQRLIDYLDAKGRG